MGGLFGGVLGAINFLGGVALYVLVGRVAWNENETATWIRTFVGSIVAGEVIGLLVLCIHFLPRYSGGWSQALMTAGFEHGFLTFFLIPDVCVVICVVLQLVKDWLTQ